jgi:hypothetical protein
MINKSETLILNGTKDAVEGINNKIKEQGGTNTQIAERKNLDGDTATWIVVATLGGQALPHILNFIKEYARDKKVKKIKIGDLEIENPTPEMIQEYEKMLKNRSNQ